MKKDNISNLGNAIINLKATLGYIDTDNVTIAVLINKIVEKYDELVVKNKYDSATLKFREEECKKLREQVDGYKQLLNTLYGDNAQTLGYIDTDNVQTVSRFSVNPDVPGHTKTDDHASATAVVFSTPVGYIPINTDLQNLNEVKYIRDLYYNLREHLKDALNEIDSLRKDLAEERKDRKAAENDRDTNSAIIASVYDHFSDSMNMDSEEFQNIVDYCREWI